LERGAEHGFTVLKGNPKRLLPLTWKWGRPRQAGYLCLFATLDFVVLLAGFFVKTNIDDIGGQFRTWRQCKAQATFDIDELYMGFARVSKQNQRARSVGGPDVV
jgi:hypothetical protein